MSFLPPAHMHRVGHPWDWLNRAGLLAWVRTACGQTLTAKHDGDRDMSGQDCQACEEVARSRGWPPYGRRRWFGG